MTRLLQMVLHRISYLCVLAGIVTPCFGGLRDIAASENDHLMPVNDILDPGYYGLLSRKLFVTSSDFGRVLDLPAGKAEVAIAIYSKRGGTSRDVLITCTKASKELWYAGSDEQFHFTKNPSVSVRRVDVLFPKSTANAVSEGIKRVLRQSRSPTKGNIATVDGGAIEFSIENQKGVFTRGILPPFARGKNSSALHRLTNLLRAYCDSKPVNQVGLAREIETEAIRLGK